MKNYIIAISVVLLSLITLGGIKGLQIGALIASGEEMGEFPETVQLKTVESAEWEVGISSVGSLAPIEGTTIRSEAEGVVEEILFKPGSQVKAGTLLVKLDDDVENSNLETAKAALDLAKINIERTRQLYERDSLSKSEFDTSDATYKGAVAQFENLKAIQNKKHIKAPFDGKLGVKQISQGDYLNRGDVIVEIQDLSALFINFSIPQQNLSFIKEGYTVIVQTDAWPNEKFEGKITAIDPAINSQTRTLSIQGTLTNAEEKLRPGMFVTLEVFQPEKRKVIYVPQTAILNRTYGNTVFAVINPNAEKLRVEQRIVRLGETKGDFVEIKEGLEAGETIVSSGAFKLRDGSLISPSDKGTIEPKLEPAPSEG